jgi:hypothetical protein
MTYPSPPTDWPDVLPGVKGIFLRAVRCDLEQAVLLKEVWDEHCQDHANLALNWAAFCETLAKPDEVRASRARADARVHRKEFASLVYEDGSRRRGELWAIVDRADRVVSAYVFTGSIGSRDRRLGKRLWP